MTIAFREVAPEFRDAILALRTRAFPDDDREKQDPRFWDWEFGGGRMFVALDGDRVVAHLGFVPQTYVVGGRAVRGMLAVDAMTDPDYRRQHLFSRVAQLARETLRHEVALSTAWQIREAVLPAMVQNGWEPVARASVLVRPLGWGREGGELPVHGSADGLSALNFFGRAAHQPRSSEFLSWRFGANPLWRYTIDRADGAYLITRRTPLRGHDTLAIADVGWEPGREVEAKILLRDAVRRAREAGLRFAAALSTLSHPAMPILVRAGFLPSPHRFRLLVNVFDETLPVARARWGMSWADTDHL